MQIEKEEREGEEKMISLFEKMICLVAAGVVVIVILPGMLLHEGGRFLWSCIR